MLRSVAQFLCDSWAACVGLPALCVTTINARITCTLHNRLMWVWLLGVVEIWSWNLVTGSNWEFSFRWTDCCSVKCTTPLIACIGHILCFLICRSCVALNWSQPLHLSVYTLILIIHLENQFRELKLLLINSDRVTEARQCSHFPAYGHGHDHKG